MECQVSTWRDVISCAAITHVGMRRHNNQDSLKVALANSDEEWVQQGHLFLVADGMGAHAAGEFASRLAADSIPLSYRKLAREGPAYAIREAIQDANRQIHVRGQGSDEFRGMGTTLCALILFPNEAFLAHVGDSRVYRLRGNQFEQLTFDHSLAWELRAAQRVAPHSEFMPYIPKNVITRSLGPNPEVNVDLEGPFELKEGDVFVLCTDGLSGPIPDDQIGKIVACLPPAEAAELLVHLANFKGGPDNITVIIVRVNRVDQARSSSQRRWPSSKTKTGWFSKLAAWSALIGVFVAALGLWLAQSHVIWIGLIILILGVVAFLGDYFWRFWPWNWSSAPARKFRSGPYHQLECRPDRAFCEQLREFIDNLTQHGQREQWPIDSEELVKYQTSGEEALGRNDFREAARQFGKAISHLMKPLFSRPN